MSPDAIVLGMVVGGILLSLGNYSALASQPKSTTIDKGPAVAEADVKNKHAGREQ